MGKILYYASSLILVLGCEPVVANVSSYPDDWFRNAKYGAFVHYLAPTVTDPKSLHSDFTRRDWNDCVNAFDVEAFAENMARAGVGYVIFTTMQGSQYMVAPNSEYDRLYGFSPGEACAKRDLLMDLSDALEKRSIPLVLYFTGDGPTRVADPDLAARMRARDGFKTPLPVEFVEKWARVMECYARRYGRRVRGWWIDGCYTTHGEYGYTPEKLQLYKQAALAGNADAIVAFNNPSFGDTPVLPYVDIEDYSAGEKMEFQALPEPNGLLSNGKQWHIASYLGNYWDQPGVRYDVAQLGQYLYLTSRNGGVVSIDLLCFWDGGLDRAQIATLSQMREEIGRWNALARSTETNNMAYLKPTRVLGLSGQTLPVQRGCVRKPLNATDGRTDTYIQASEEWAWQLEIDLEAVRAFSCVKIHYWTGNFATRLRTSVSSDRKSWRVVDERDNADPTQTCVRFGKTTGRYVRVAALKPDGKGQLGSQMGVAEVGVFDE